MQAQRTVVVTGAAGDIGHAIARAFAALGDRLILNDISPERLDTVVSGLSGHGLSALAAVGDVTVQDEVERLFSVAAETGAVDVLVNCAALVGFAAVADTLSETVGHWRRVLDVSLTGAFLCSRAAARHMIETGSGGTIINISSISGIAAEENAAAYCTAKAGLIGLTRSMALDLAVHGVRVNAIAPGWIDTATSRAPVVMPKTLYPKHTPLGPGHPTDIASMTMFLASEEARFVTGSTFVVDGGWSLY